MLCSKFKYSVLTKATIHNNVHFRSLSTTRDIFKKWVWIDDLLASVVKRESSGMSPLRIILKDLRVWSGWTRNSLVNTVVRRCRRDRGVREVIQCFKHAFLRPRRTLLISATAAYKARGDDDEHSEKLETSCEKSITDDELQALIEDLDDVEKLSRSTLFCAYCGKRLVIDKKVPGVGYCVCKVAQLPKATDHTDGWVPYMEADGVIIWRKEYKPGLGLYAYKVYGRYPEVRASDFAAVQVDGAYRRVWDDAVAALAVVQRGANGLADQAVLHWEVLWPRLFANRDYVFIRRHKEFDVMDRGVSQKDCLFDSPASDVQLSEPIYTERPSVHSNAKRKALETYSVERKGEIMDNKVYVIVSRSCCHPDVPETKHAVRVSEYWSHMVVKTIQGSDKSGMEFVLTYYDEPAVGGMPCNVATWATGRAAPAYLQRMRRAAIDYRAWRLATQQEMPDFTPFVTKGEEDGGDTTEKINEQDMESSQQGPDMENNDSGDGEDLQTRSQGTQTEEGQADKRTGDKVDKSVYTEADKCDSQDGEDPKTADEEEPKNGGWWRYIYPLYYFI